MPTNPDLGGLVREQWERSYISDAEADTIILAQDSLRGSSEDWSQFYVSALTGHILNAKGAQGCVDDRRANRLIYRIGFNNRLPGRDEFDLVLNIIEQAQECSDILRHALLQEIVLAVREGSGATRQRGVPGKGQITPEEVVFLGRILDSSSPASSPAFFREAIASLYRIKEDLTDFTKPKDWARFFVERVAEYLDSLSRIECASEAEVRAFEEFMQEEGASIADFFSRLDAGDFPDMLNRDTTLDLLDRALLETIYGRHASLRASRATRSIA